MLVGLQQRSRLDGVKTKQADLRSLCNELRRQRVATLGDYVMGADPDGSFQALFNSLVTHVRRALADPETEVIKDEWDLAIFGHGGSLSFCGSARGGCARRPSAGHLMTCPGDARHDQGGPRRAPPPGLFGPTVAESADAA